MFEFFFSSLLPGNSEAGPYPEGAVLVLKQTRNVARMNTIDGAKPSERVGRAIIAIQPTHQRADPNVAIAVLKDTPCVIIRNGGWITLALTVVCKLSSVEMIQSTEIRSDPKIIFMIGHEADHYIIPKAVGISGIMKILPERIGLPVKIN